MGAGNPLLKSFDGDEHYKPTTFFIDVTGNEPDEEAGILEMNLDDALYCISSDLEMAQDPDYTAHSELSAAFRGSGVVIAETEGDKNPDVTFALISTTGVEYHHIPLGIVPMKSRDEVEEEIWDEEKHKEDWYKARGKDFNQRIDTLVDDKMRKIYEECAALEEKLKTILIEKMSYLDPSERNGAWMSSPLIPRKQTA